LGFFNRTTGLKGKGRLTNPEQAFLSIRAYLTGRGLSLKSVKNLKFGQFGPFLLSLLGAERWIA
jgi:hypothetical protein